MYAKQFLGKEQHINDKGIALIKEFEGLSLKAYKCPGNIWTIGYGHTRTVTPDLVITKERAEELLLEDLEFSEDSVRKLVRVPLTSNQFSALVSFVYNLGETQFRSSTLLKMLNDRDYSGASVQFLRWVYSNKKKLNGLVRRREAEMRLFLEDDSDGS
jgi:lysozyme